MALDPSYFFYSDGTITLTNGSDVATGTFTAWDPAVLPFDFVFPNSGTNGMSVIEEVLAMDQIRLAQPWGGPTLTDVPYFMVRWTKHTDPKVYALRLSDYLTRLKGIPENFEEVGQQVAADAAAVASALSAITQAASSVEEDRASVAGDRTATEAARAGAEAALAAAEDVLEQVSAGSVADNAITNAKVAADAGIQASKLSFASSGTGSAIRTVEAKLREVQVSVADYGAKGDATDQTAAIQAAANAVTYNGTLYFPRGVYVVSSTISLPGGIRMQGAGVGATYITRTGNYGDTFVCGTPEIPARSFECFDINFAHSSRYEPGQTSLPSLATSGTHIRVRGAQSCTIARNRFSRLPFNLVFEGGTFVYLKNNHFYGVWDPQNAGCQEGVALVEVAYSATYGNPTSWYVEDNYFAGQTSETRNIVYTPTTGNFTKTGRSRSIGSQYGLLIRGLEDALITGNQFGGLATSEIAVFNAAGGAVIDLRIVENFFDGMTNGHGVLFEPGAAGTFSMNVTIANNTFIDQLNALKVLRNALDVKPSVYMLHVHGNTFRHCIGTPIWLGGAKGFTVAHNIIASYNNFNASPSDLTFAAAALVNDLSAKGRFHGNIVGGGGATLEDTADNYCYYGIFIDAAPSATVTQVGNVNAGVRTQWYAQTPDAPVGLRTYGKASLPAPGAWMGSLIIVADDVGGRTVAFCDSVNWRRVTDNAIIS